jgi:hypothetical protein
MFPYYSPVGYFLICLQICANGFCSPHAKNFFDAVHVHANGKVDGFIDDSAIVANFDSDSIKIDDGVNA